VNARDIYGKTPLHIACESDADNTVDVLVDEGAQVILLLFFSFSFLFLFAPRFSLKEVIFSTL
jgi:ankyrin repeat protein